MLSNVVQNFLLRQLCMFLQLLNSVLHLLLKYVSKAQTMFKLPKHETKSTLESKPELWILEYPIERRYVRASKSTFKLMICSYSWVKWSFEFLSNAAAARLPAAAAVKRPKCQSAYAAHGRYGVLGFYLLCTIKSIWIGQESVDRQNLLCELEGGSKDQLL